ncbi:MAG TPA: chromate resistance protein ChrB domain-containing protein [Lamprocystis sp. (in: g-proteobacteria)]|nr:chromate resistance protein ChrB domain-containing protein [Lamprocystis sp. (in: g-proteobacteria)]
MPVAALLFTAATVADGSGGEPGQLWSTWETFEPDKCASVWLIKRHIDPAARFRFHPSGTPITEGIPFDTPDAQLRRYHDASTFETLLRRYRPAAPGLDYLGRLLHDIEVNIWQRKALDESIPMAQALYTLTEGVPPVSAVERCLDYFDRLVTDLSTAADPDQVGADRAQLETRLKRLK